MFGLQALVDSLVLAGWVAGLLGCVCDGGVTP